MDSDARQAAAAIKRAWRYRITDSGGCLAEQAPTDSHVLDWNDMGDEYTWTVYDFTTGKVTGWMTGVFVDKGHKTVEGKYEPAA